MQQILTWFYENILTLQNPITNICQMSAKVLRIFFNLFIDQRIFDAFFSPRACHLKKKRLITKMQIFHGLYHKEIKNTNVFSISNLGGEIIFKKNSGILAQNIRVCCHLLEWFGIHI